jgi:WD40 repeat protein
MPAPRAALLLPALWLPVLLLSPSAAPAGGDRDSIVAQPPSLPTAAAVRFGSAQLRHGQPVSDLAFAPDGVGLLSVGWSESSQATVRRWESDDGSETALLRQRFASCAASSPNGRVVAVGNAVGVVRLFDADGKPLGKIAGDQGRIAALVFTAGGDRLLTAGGSGGLRLWDVKNGTEIRAYLGHDGEVLAAAASADGQKLASAGADSTVRLWDAENKTARKQFERPAANKSVALTPDGKTLFAAGEDEKIRRWDADAGKELPALEGHEKTVRRLVVSADGKTLASADAGGTMRIWDLETSKERCVIPKASVDGRVLALSPDGKRAATVGPGHTLRVWDAVKGEERTPGGPRHAPVVGAAVDPKGKTLATVGEDGVVHLWDAATGKEQKSLGEAGAAAGGLISAAWDGNGRRLVIAGGDTATVWDAVEGTAARRFGTPLTCAAVSGNGATLALFGPKEQFHVRDIDDEMKAVVADGPGSASVCAALSTNGRLLAAADADSLRIWDLKTDLTPQLRQEKKAAGVTALAFGPHGRLLAAGRDDGVLVLWDPAAGKPVRALGGHPGRVHALAFSPNGRWLASCGEDHVVRLWETFTGLPAMEYSGHSGAVNTVTFAADGRTLYSGGDDGTALAWDLAGGHRGGAERPPKPGAGDLLRFWGDLLSDDGPAAFRAQWDLAAAPEQSVPFVEERLKPLFGPDAQRVVKLIADLDADEFMTREKASLDLEAMGSAVEPALREALAHDPSAEVKGRLERLLTKIKTAVPWEQERRRVLRALAVLELSGAPAARKILETAAKSATFPEIREAAAEALERMPKP